MSKRISPFMFTHFKVFKNFPHCRSHCHAHNTKLGLLWNLILALILLSIGLTFDEPCLTPTGTWTKWHFTNYFDIKAITDNALILQEHLN